MQASNDVHAATTTRILGDLLSDYHGSYRVRLWDGSSWPAAHNGNGDPAFTLVLNHPGSLRRMFGRQSMLHLGEAFLSDAFEVEGDLLSACEFGDHLLRLRLPVKKKLALAMAIRSLPKDGRAIAGRSRANLSGAVGSRARLRDAISYHYDLPVDFWKQWLDSTLAYSCAYFENSSDSLDQAQANKLDYVCKKLYLSPGELLLDLGCGWGGLVTFAVRNHGVKAIGITLSRQQAEYGKELIRRLGLQGKCEIRQFDFRDFESEEQFDKISCIGAVEHVSVPDLPAFFNHAAKLLKPGGLFLNHGITTSIKEVHPSGRSFVDAYVFPDHDVTTISQQLMAAEAAGFEVRDVECLREHYIRTCTEWLERIEANQEALIAHSNRVTQRVFRLYVAAQTYYFRTGASSIHQALLAKSDSRPLRIPPTRAAWYDAQSNAK